MTDSTTFIGPHAAGVMEQAVDDDLIVFDPDSESYYTLNRTAREVWELADGTRTATIIAETLAARYEAEPAQVAPDVAAIIANLAEAGLI
ncbi:MAG: HPr-rel-A system PqqD family peptide chaperone [bacterium]|nr:HPr-rel-A system PqqD family peptide chaperone [bacterium]